LGDRADVLGVHVDRLTMDETVALLEQAIDERRLVQHVCVNAANIVALRGDARLRAIVEACEVVSADGQPVVWASRLVGDPLPERVNGTDLMFRLIALAERRGYGVFVLGATQETLDQALATLRADYPGLRIAGSHHGWFPDAESAEVARTIAAAAPEILFVAISSPRKEYFLAEHGRDLGVPLVMGVGGSIDIVAGRTRRAPRWMRSAGLEWLFRLAQEPRRLARRYAVTNVRFIGIVGKETVRRRLRRA
jgi:N-acetylglucosaminyldiphosphoundecaprenol N-acetyl-beta-D-mannosaminyltransferase